MQRGSIPKLIEALEESTSLDVKREASRALGNLAANCEYGRIMFRKDVVAPLTDLLRSDHVGCQRMASMALANISTNVKLQTRLIKMEVVEPMITLASRGLDAKATSDAETERYCLLCLANLAVSPENHETLITTGALNLVLAFSKVSHATSLTRHDTSLTRH